MGDSARKTTSASRESAKMAFAKAKIKEIIALNTPIVTQSFLANKNQHGPLQRNANLWVRLGALA